ncbi:MAG: DUF3619 family protein [Rhodoferax sp.]
MTTHLTTTYPPISGYQTDLAVDRFGLKVASRLTDACESGAGALGHDISERLRVARAQAVAARKKPALARGTVVLASGGAASLALGGDEPGLWSRIAAFLPLIALVAGLIAINTIQNDRRANEVAEVDAALLTDDLPPSAYTDPGFAQFLKSRREAGQ